VTFPVIISTLISGLDDTGNLLYTLVEEEEEEEEDCAASAPAVDDNDDNGDNDDDDDDLTLNRCYDRISLTEMMPCDGKDDGDSANRLEFIEKVNAIMNLKREILKA
jgi:hypothetical protein